MSPRRTLPSAVLAAAVLLTMSVGLASADSQRAFVAKLELTGDKEVVGTTCAPPMVCGDPDGSGEARIWIVPALDRVCWRLSWENLDPVIGAHIHGLATTSQAAGVLVPLSIDPAEGCAVSTFADAIAADPANYYVNVHSTVYPAGAIRAQLD